MKVSQIGSDIGSFDPFNIADFLDITIEFVDDLPENHLGLSIRPLDTIFISADLFDEPMRYFICAHELTHYLEHEDMQPYYNSSNSNKNKTEYHANRSAVGLLCRYYFDSFQDIRISVQMILDYFGIPQDLFDLVSEEMKTL